MPSANPKLEKQASTETAEPIKQAITVVEHKIRNLEKRKGKLESYRDIVKNGGELNADQKTAVAKYDEVQQTLDITRELYKQIVGIANDAAKQQKKLARKEALERMQQDIAKVREVLLIQDTIMNMGTQSVRDDFLKGNNGAVQLTEDDLKYLDDLYLDITLKHERQPSEQPYQQQAQKVAEHYVLIVEGKQREAFGTTYSKIKEIVSSIHQCGYFDHVQQSEAAVDEVAHVVVETQISYAQEQQQKQPAANEEYNCERHIPTPSQPETMLPMQTFPVPVAAIPVVSGAPAIPVVAQAIAPLGQAPVDATYYANPAFMHPVLQQQQQQKEQDQPQQPGAPAQAPRINDVIGPAPNFFFLQDSELDQPESAASQAPPVVSHIPAPVVAAAVTLNAPIPTQTFTNQTFGGPPVVPQQVVYPHQPQDLSHLPAFSAGNPPPPIPMPQTHQATMQFNQQNQNSFQPPQTSLQSFDERSHQLLSKDDRQENLDKLANSTVENEVLQSTETSAWGQDVNDWTEEVHSPPSNQESHSPQQAWGDRERGFGEKGFGEKGFGEKGFGDKGFGEKGFGDKGFGEKGFGGRGRGRGRGNSNGFSAPKTRGFGQQNGRGGGSYYRNNADGNYQNGYQRNWNNGNNEGNGGSYNNSYRRSTSNQSRGGPRGGERGGRGSGGQFRGNQRGGANRPNYAPRGKAQSPN